MRIKIRVKSIKLMRIFSSRPEIALRLRRVSRLTHCQFLREILNLSARLRSRAVELFIYLSLFLSRPISLLTALRSHRRSSAVDRITGGSLERRPCATRLSRGRGMKTVPSPSRDDDDDARHRPRDLHRSRSIIKGSRFVCRW